MKKVIIIVLILLLIIPIISLAQETNEEYFITSENYEVAIGESLTITIDLAKIPYEDFIFTLNSSLDLSEIELEDDVEVDVNTDTNGLEISINKSQLDLEYITLSYMISEDIEVGTEIEFLGRVEEKETGEYKENILTFYIIEKSEEETEVTEKLEDEKIELNEDNKTFSEMNESSNNFNQERTASGETNTTMTESISGISVANSSLNQETESVTYEGESNNYLSSLEIDGYDILPDFSKTCQTYFIEVGSDVSSITITATAEDENAKVTLYGNEDLSEGENKVLVSVTAENGTVRFYRIYVTKDA